MKVLLVNGSPHKNGCTNRALEEVAFALQKQGVETEIFWIGVKPVSGCLGCGSCRKLGECVVDDVVNEFAKKFSEADGFVFGSPVHFASGSGAMTAFMDRLFYSASKDLAYKPAATIVSCRRGGASSTFDQMNKYFTINNMPVVSSNYWNQVHGNVASEVEKDEEGLQTMRILGYNMAWLIRCNELGKTAGVAPEKENKIRTNFIQ